jgi:hypothetical protein
MKKYTPAASELLIIRSLRGEIFKDLQLLVVDLTTWYGALCVVGAAERAVVVNEGNR